MNDPENKTMPIPQSHSTDGLGRNVAQKIKWSAIFVGTATLCISAIYYRDGFIGSCAALSTMICWHEWNQR